MKKRLHPILTKLFWGVARHFLPDKGYAKVRYWLEQDECPNIERPKKFTEKIQFIKLYERTDLRKKVADRTKVRNYVAEKAGKEHLIPLIDTFDTLTASVWNALPPQFVLKANHGCGMIRIVPDKEQEKFDDIRQQTDSWKRTNYFTIGREWVYKDLPRTLLAEALLLDADNNIPKDYKFFCFDGRVKLIQVDYDRFGTQKRNLFDRDFNRIDGRLLYPPYPGNTKKPEHFNEAIEVAEKLSAPFSFIRVDLYLPDNYIYFGEMTNYPGNGFVTFEPEALEYQIGSWLDLNR